jgi:hypothetical protein
VAAVLVVSLVLPAATKQWSDNQQQRQLKTEVTTKLASAVAQATTEGGFLLADQLEVGQSQTITRAAYKDTLVTWKSEAYAIDAQLVEYFAQTRDSDKDSLVLAMRAYTRMVEDYLAYCLFFRTAGGRNGFREDFEENLGKMREQAGRAALTRVIPTQVYWVKDDKPPEGFKEAAQNVWAQNIVNASAPIIVMVNQRQPRGLQVGARAFIRQILQPIG